MRSRDVGDAQLPPCRALFIRLALGGAEDLSGGPVEGFAGGILLQNDPCAAVLFQDPGILLLVVIGDVRGGDDGRSARAVISLMVEAPARQITRSAARMTGAMS